MSSHTVPTCEMLYLQPQLCHDQILILGAESSSISTSNLVRLEDVQRSCRLVMSE